VPRPRSCRTAERAKTVNLSDGAYYQVSEFTQLKDSNIRSIEDLKGKSVGTIQGYFIIRDLELERYGLTYRIAFSKFYHTATGLGGVLALALQQHGGEIVCGKEVTAIRYANERAIGVVLSEGTGCRSDIVLSHADHTRAV